MAMPCNNEQKRKIENKLVNFSHTREKKKELL